MAVFCTDISTMTNQFGQYYNLAKKFRQKDISDFETLKLSKLEKNDVKSCIELILKLGLFGQFEGKNGDKNGIPYEIQQLILWARGNNDILSQTGQIDGNLDDSTSQVFSQPQFSNHNVHFVNSDQLTPNEFVDDLVTLLYPFFDPDSVIGANAINTKLDQKTGFLDQSLLLPCSKGGVLSLPINITSFLDKLTENTTFESKETQNSQIPAQNSPHAISHSDYPFIQTIRRALSSLTAIVTLTSNTKQYNLNLKYEKSSINTHTNPPSSPQTAPRITHCNCPACLPLLPTELLLSPIFDDLHNLILKSMLSIAYTNAKLDVINVQGKVMANFKQHAINEINPTSANGNNFDTFFQKSQNCPNPFDTFKKFLTPDHFEKISALTADKLSQYSYISSLHNEYSNEMKNKSTLSAHLLEKISKPSNNPYNYLRNHCNGIDQYTPDLDYSFIPQYIHRTEYNYNQNNQSNRHNNQNNPNTPNAPNTPNNTLFTINRYKSVFPAIQPRLTRSLNVDISNLTHQIDQNRLRRNNVGSRNDITPYSLFSSRDFFRMSNIEMTITSISPHVPPIAFTINSTPVRNTSILKEEVIELD
jgi:hypothetical protein